MADDLRLEHFSSRVGDPFEFGTGDAWVPVTLTHATALPHGVREAGSFRLEWQGEAAQLLGQGLYSVRDPGGEAHDIFVVPIACDAAGARYEAIFN